MRLDILSHLIASSVTHKMIISQRTDGSVEIINPNNMPSLFNYVTASVRDQVDQLKMDENLSGLWKVAILWIDYIAIQTAFDSRCHTGYRTWPIDRLSLSKVVTELLHGRMVYAIFLQPVLAASFQ